MISVPIVTPTSEMTGALAAGIAWRRMTRPGVRPLPRAVRTKSSSNVSASDARIIRMVMAASGSPRTIHGSHSDCSHASGSWVSGW